MIWLRNYFNPRLRLSIAFAACWGFTFGMFISDRADLLDYANMPFLQRAGGVLICLIIISVFFHALYSFEDEK